MGTRTSISREVVGAIVALVAVVGGGAWWSWTQAEAASKAERRLRIQQTQWRALAASEPAPIATVAAELSRQLEDAEGIVADLRRQLGAGRRDAIKAEEVPATRADAYFALAQFMQRQQAAAERAGVELPDNPAFGFSAHRNSGPADEHRILVHRQMLVLERLLTTLWESQAEKLVRVQRENPLLRVGEGSTAATAREGDPGDWLVWPASRSLRSRGIVDTMALRISWVGRTATLRAWLQLLRDVDVPVVVREIQVEPAAEARSRGGRRNLADLFRDAEEEMGGEEADAAGPIPLIEDNRALFWVTLEYLDLAGDAGFSDGEQRAEDLP